MRYPVVSQRHPMRSAPMKNAAAAIVPTHQRIAEERAVDAKAAAAMPSSRQVRPGSSAPGCWRVATMTYSPGLSCPRRRMALLD